MNQLQTTNGDLTETLREIFNASTAFNAIGTRHGKKHFDTLLARDEAAKAVDFGENYRIPAETRNVNYGLFYESGEERITRAGEYNSHNTRRLGRDALKAMLLDLDYGQVVLQDREGDLA